MKNLKIYISFGLVITIACLLIMNVPASAYDVSRNSINNVNQSIVQQFDVVSLDTLTGFETVKEYDTSVTSYAMSCGVTELSTPAHMGTDAISDTIDSSSMEISTMGIVGDDNRKRVYSPQKSFPYRAICRIVSYWDRNNDGVIDNIVGVGTGFLEGPSAVVTAGHCIYDSEKKMWCKYATVTFAQDGPNSAPYGTIRSTTIHTSSAWINNGDSNQDWAVVEIGTDIGNKTGWFGKLWTADSLNNTNITVAGYSGDLASSKNDSSMQRMGKYMWYCNGNIINSLPAKLEYNADTWSGNSGGPVYNSSCQVLAIHTYGVGSSKNGGTRITEWLYNFLVQFQE